MIFCTKMARPNPAVGRAMLVPSTGLRHHNGQPHGSAASSCSYPALSGCTQLQHVTGSALSAEWCGIALLVRYPFTYIRHEMG